MSKHTRILFVLITLMVLLAGCGLIEPVDLNSPDLKESVVPLLEIPGTEDFSKLGRSNSETTTLSTLRKVDDYPLYTMKYFGEYKSVELLNQNQRPGKKSVIPWGCSLFAALADPDNILFGRNFDWDFSPALILFTDPPDGYASVSMVDIAFLGFDEREARNIDPSTNNNLTDLMRAPELPFDGVNEKGLAIGMAAVPAGEKIFDPYKNTIGSIGIIRKVLDHASNVDDAIAIMTPLQKG